MFVCVDTRPPSAGESLRRAREAQGRTLRDVAGATKIGGDYLRALEEGDYASLPERPLARGYLRHYAAELGVDEGAALAEFDRAVPPRPEISVARRGSPAARGGGVPLAAAALSALVVVAVLGWFGYALWQSRAAGAETPSAAAALPATERQIRLNVTSQPPGARVYLDNRYLGQTPVKDFPLEARVSGQLRVELAGYVSVVRQVALDKSRNLRLGLSVVSPAGGGARSVTLRFAGRSWVSVTGADGQVLYEGLPEVGSSRQFPAGVTVQAGTPSAVWVTLGTDPAVPLGSGEAAVTRRFP